LRQEIINSWTCFQCNLYNDILTVHCKDCSANRPLNLSRIASVIKYKRLGLNLTSAEKQMAETDRIELHTKFYNHEKPLYSSMSFEQRRAHRDEIALILLEGRARMNAIDDVDRDENAKRGPKGREWLTSNQNQAELGTDAISQPKIRKDRMSKADKLAEEMAKLGLSKADIDKALGAVASAQSGGSVVTSSTREMKSASYVFTKETTSNNTKESLLSDLATSLTDGINDRPIEHLVEAAVTAGHLANKILGPVIEEVKEFKPEVIQEVKETSSFDPTKLFGSK